jgi:hypothetical protein
MRLAEMLFTDWYHKYVTIEVDDLTELLKDSIAIHDDDCYALCSSYCNNEGFTLFNVLSVGNSWDNCTRGLRSKKMLGTFSIDMVLTSEAKIVEPTNAMKYKNEDFLKMMDEDCDEDVLRSRLDPRLDLLRDPFYPDVGMTGIAQDGGLAEYAMHITGVKGLFLTGTIAEQPPAETGIEEGDMVYALLYLNGSEYRLFALFAGDHLNEDEQDVMNQIMKETAKLGIDFNGISMKS